MTSRGKLVWFASGVNKLLRCYQNGSIFSYHGYQISRFSSNSTVLISIIRSKQYNFPMYLRKYYRTPGSNSALLEKIEYPNEERWLQKVHKDINARKKHGGISMKCVKKKVEILKGLGCIPYEVLEWPEVLYLTEKQIKQSEERLKDCGATRISVPLLRREQYKDCKNNSALKKEIAKLQKSLEGNSSYAEFWKVKLECSEKELLFLANQNSRLFISRNFKQVTYKVEFLLQNGFSQKDILKSSHVLKNQTLPVLKRRIEECRSLDLEFSSFIKTLAQPQSVYEKRLSLMKKKKKEENDRLPVLSELLSVPQTEIKKVPILMKMTLPLLVEKLEFLVKEKNIKGITVMENSSTLDLTVERLKASVSELEAGGYEDLTLGLIYNYAVTNKVAQKRAAPQYLLAKILDCHYSEINLKNQRVKLVMNGHSKENWLPNLDFFKQVGIAKTSLQKCPVILAHSPKVIKDSWKDLLKRTDIPVLRLLDNDQVKLLNLFQYFIEKEHNFPIVVETLLYEQEDLTELEQSRMMNQIQAHHEL